MIRNTVMSDSLLYFVYVIVYNLVYVIRLSSLEPNFNLVQGKQDLLSVRAKTVYSTCCINYTHEIVSKSSFDNLSDKKPLITSVVLNCIQYCVELITILSPSQILYANIFPSRLSSSRALSSSKFDITLSELKTCPGFFMKFCVYQRCASK